MTEGLVRGTQVRITSGRYSKMLGTVDSNVYGTMIDSPGEISMGYGVILDNGEWVMVQYHQVITRFKKSADHLDWTG